MHGIAPPTVAIAYRAPTDPFISRHDTDTDIVTKDAGSDSYKYLDCSVGPAAVLPILHRTKSRSKSRTSNPCPAAASAAAEVMRLPCVSFSPYETVYKFDQCRARKQ
jgi:hypothetical protein